VFNVYPITVLMLIPPAPQKDLPLLDIACDTPASMPGRCAGTCPGILTDSTAPGAPGVIKSFPLSFILRENGFSEGMIQGLVFLKLIVAGWSALMTAIGREYALWMWPVRRLGSASTTPRRCGPGAGCVHATRHDASYKLCSSPRVA